MWLPLLLSSLMIFCLRAEATRTTLPVKVALQAELSQSAELQEVSEALQSLLHWASHPLAGLHDAKVEAQATIHHLKWLLTSEAVHRQLGEAALELHDQVEVLEQIIELVGWTPTAAMQLLEIKRGWQWAQRAP